MHSSSCPPLSNVSPNIAKRNLTLAQRGPQSGDSGVLDGLEDSKNAARCRVLGKDEGEASKRGVRNKEISAMGAGTGACKRKGLLLSGIRGPLRSRAGECGYDNAPATVLREKTPERWTSPSCRRAHPHGTLAAPFEHKPGSQMPSCPWPPPVETCSSPPLFPRRERRESNPFPRLAPEKALLPEKFEPRGLPRSPTDPRPRFRGCLVSEGIFSPTLVFEPFERQRAESNAKRSRS
ncbi:hypothetical protein KM043_018006 [Ampulex compressa]|nr:hypothetical protein KM043_018006 [Ampulex compressa]